MLLLLHHHHREENAKPRLEPLLSGHLCSSFFFVDAPIDVGQRDRSSQMGPIALYCGSSRATALARSKRGGYKSSMEVPLLWQPPEPFPEPLHGQCR